MKRLIVTMVAAALAGTRQARAREIAAGPGHVDITVIPGGAQFFVRLLAVRSDDTAPAFFGQATRYGHRIYGGVLINAVR